MALAVIVCLASFFWLLAIARVNQFSFGLPIAYLFTLLLIHVPGAFAHIVGNDFLPDNDLTAIGIKLTAIGCVCFVVGVRLARRSVPDNLSTEPVDRRTFSLFCVLGGWCVTYALSALHQYASIGAVVDQAGYIWIIGVLLGLRRAVHIGDLKWVGIWLAALGVYPVITLVSGGFMTWGYMTEIIVLSSLTISTLSYRRALIGITLTVILGMGVFTTYFLHRTEIRDQVWGGAPIADRVRSVVDAFSQFEWFDPRNPTHLEVLDDRLNQNYFVGAAAQRIQDGQVGYLSGATIWDGVLGLIPRALWPEKSVAVGSGNIVISMTGLELDETAAWGVGSVMEFYINFGVWGIIIGFLLLGWLIGTVDLRAALAERQGKLGKLILIFLPAPALMSPGGSVVDLTTAYAAGLIAAFGWKYAWEKWSAQRSRNPKLDRRHRSATVLS